MYVGLEVCEDRRGEEIDGLLVVLHSQRLQPLEESVSSYDRQEGCFQLAFGVCRRIVFPVFVEQIQHCNHVFFSQAGILSVGEVVGEEPVLDTPRDMSSEVVWLSDVG